MTSTEIKPFTIPDDVTLVRQLFTDNVTITSRHGDGYVRDVLAALEDVLYRQQELQEEAKEMTEMGRHIDKLEAMLDRRKARYKKWEDRYL